MQAIIRVAVISAFIFILVLGASVVFSYAKHFTTFTEFFAGSFKEHQDKKAELLFVGDVMLARSVEKRLAEHGADYPYLRLPKQEEHSFRIANFEASIPTEHRHTQDGTFAFSVHEKYLKALHEHGFHYLGLANNHSYDFGSSNFLNTKEVLKEQGFTAFGDQVDQGSSTIAYTDASGVRVALIGVYAVFEKPESEALLQLLMRAQEKSDMQVVYIHWGTEYELIHSTFQENLAKELISYGADAIIGHHPHVVQDIAIYDNVPVFYSLGNFVFDQFFSKEVQEGLMVKLRVEKNVLTYTLEPITSADVRSQPRLMNEEEKVNFLKKLSERSSEEYRSSIASGSLTFPR